VATRVVWSCIICGFRAEERPPRHCPNCGVSAGKFRMHVDRAPELPPKEEPKELPKEQPSAEEPKKEAMAS